MRPIVYIGIMLMGGLIAFDYFSPHSSSVRVEVTVVSVADAPQGNGWRRITVEMPMSLGGDQQTIETLVPFFYKPRYPAWLVVKRRLLFTDIYDFTSPPSAAK